MHEVQRPSRRVLLVVGVVEALTHLHGDVASHGHGHGLAALARAVEDRAQVLALHVLHRDEVALAHLPQVEDLSDVRVRELHGDLRLVDEHDDEFLVLRDGGQDALQRNEALEAFDAEGLGLENLGHAADVHSLEEKVLSEGDGLLHHDPRLRNSLGVDSSMVALDPWPMPRSRTSVWTVAALYWTCTDLFKRCSRWSSGWCMAGWWMVRRAGPQGLDLPVQGSLAGLTYHA